VGRKLPVKHLQGGLDERQMGQRATGIDFHTALQHTGLSLEKEAVIKRVGFAAGHQ
jgi:hypothetical protein